MPKRELDELVLRAQRGDAAAFAELFREHRRSVARIAFRMLGPHADLDDVIQEVFLQVYRSLPDFRGQSKFSTWLHRVAVNVVLMTRRRARSRPVYAPDEAEDAPADQGDPGDELVRKRQLAAFRQHIDQLGEKKRAVYLLHEVEGMGFAEIATLLDCPVLTVRTRLFYARKELCERMRGDPVLAQVIGDDGSGSGGEDE